MSAPDLGIVRAYVISGLVLASVVALVILLVGLWSLLADFMWAVIP